MSSSQDTGSMKAMREVVKKVLDAVKHLSRTHNDDLPEDVRAVLGGVAFDANAALAAPPRNCEVGTAEEQYRRHGAFCDATRKGMSGYHCEDAPWCVFCFAKWAQLPYKDGGETK